MNKDVFRAQMHITINVSARKHCKSKQNELFNYMATIDELLGTLMAKHCDAI